MKLLRRGYLVRVGKSNANEIDFVAALGNEKIYVQVTYLLATEETVEIEFTVLETIPDNYPNMLFQWMKSTAGEMELKTSIFATSF